MTQRHKLFNPPPTTNFDHNTSYVHLPALDQNFLPKVPTAVTDLNVLTEIPVPQSINTQGHVNQMNPASDTGSYTCYAPAEVPYYASDRIIFSYDTHIAPANNHLGNSESSLYMEQHQTGNITLPLSQHVYDGNMASTSGFNVNMHHGIAINGPTQQLPPLALPNPN